MPRIGLEDVDSMRWIGGTGRRLEGASPSVPATDLQQVLLDLEVTGIGEGCLRVDRAREGDRQRAAQGDTEGDPNVEGQAEPESSFDGADPRLRQTDPTAEIGLRHMTTLAGIPYDTAK